MDMYNSNGLTLWKIMCNGEDPHTRSYWDWSHENITSGTKIRSSTPVRMSDFVALKKSGNALQHLAIDTLRGRPRSDVDLEKSQRVIKVTLRLDSASRATSFLKIIKILRQENSENYSSYVSTL
jgi:hypothetical protein